MLQPWKLRALIPTTALLLFLPLAPAQSAETAQNFPTLTLSLTAASRESGEKNRFEVYINERLVDEVAWLDQRECTTDKALALFKTGGEDIATDFLDSAVFTAMTGLDRLPLAAMAKDFAEIRLVVNGRLAQVVSPDGVLQDPPDCPDGTCEIPPDCPDGTCEPPPPDCVPTTTTTGPTCGDWATTSTSSHSYARPCILNFDECGNPVLGSQTCTVTVTVQQRTCTLVTVTTWTPSGPGITCPSPVRHTETTTQTQTQTGAPVCGGCG